jgi:hypothetical protein
MIGEFPSKRSSKTWLTSFNSCDKTAAMAGDGDLTGELTELCARVAKERDPKKLNQLIACGPYPPFER